MSKITICDLERSWVAIQRRLLSAPYRREYGLVGHDPLPDPWLHCRFCGVPVSVGIVEYDRVTPTECTQKVTSAASFVRDPVSARPSQDLAQRMDYPLISIWI